MYMDVYFIGSILMAITSYYKSINNLVITILIILLTQLSLPSSQAIEIFLIKDNSTNLCHPVKVSHFFLSAERRHGCTTPVH